MLSYESVRDSELTVGSDCTIISVEFEEGAEFMACLTESGRVIDTSPMSEGKGVLELVDGSWVPARSPLFGEEVMNARVLSDAELASYMAKSDKAN